MIVSRISMRIARRMTHLIQCIWRAIVQTIDHDGVEHAGYMSFMVLFSIFPFIVFFLALTSFLGASELGSHFVELILESLPSDATASIRERIYELVKAPPYSLMTLAIIGSIWTSSSFVEGLRTILNRVYGISSPPTYLLRRLLSIAQFLAISLIISFVMFLLIAIPIAIRKIPNIEHILNYHALWEYIRYCLIFISLFLTVSTFYYILPNVKIRFCEVIPGAIMTVFLWIGSGLLLSNYLVYWRQLSLVYGSLGSIIVTLLFFYIFNMLFIYGAEFNYQLNKDRT